jgi:hypothetical protein
MLRGSSRFHALSKMESDQDLVTRGDGYFIAIFSVTAIDTSTGIVSGQILIQPPFSWKPTDNGNRKIYHFAALGLPTISVSRETFVKQGFFKETLSIQAFTTSALFPNDYGSFDFNELSGEPVQGDASALGYGSSTKPTVVSMVTLDRLLPDWNVRGNISTSNPKDPAVQQLTSRGLALGPGARLYPPFRYVLFVYAMTFSPMLLAIPWLIAQIVSQRVLDVERPSSLELAATLLALLGIRQVLVPADLAGLTRVDKILGLELVGIVALSACVFTWNLRSPQATPTPAIPGPAAPVVSNTVALHRMHGRPVPRSSIGPHRTLAGHQRRPTTPGGP